jgi:hypothetical protein
MCCSRYAKENSCWLNIAELDGAVTCGGWHSQVVKVLLEMPMPVPVQGAHCVQLRCR